VGRKGIFLPIAANYLKAEYDLAPVSVSRIAAWGGHSLKALIYRSKML
jgi:hypothetical protein